MNRYLITLFPEKAKTVNISIKDSLKTVLDVAETYNQNAKRAANKKWIEMESIKLNKDTISFILASDAWLEFPTKAIKGFITELAKLEPYRSLITSNGRLFKGDFEHIEETAEDRVLSDEETLIEVTKLFFRKTEENRKKIEAIKNILGGN